MDRRFDTCFCDEACRRTRDCCFRLSQLVSRHGGLRAEHYPAQLCVVDPWSYWSGCSQPCQVTFRERRRRVQQEPSNASEACPPGWCLEYLDHQGQSCALDRGPAFNTSAKYGRGGVKRTYKEIRQAKGRYSVEFGITRLFPHCTVEGRSYACWIQYLRDLFPLQSR